MKGPIMVTGSVALVVKRLVETSNLQPEFIHSWFRTYCNWAEIIYPRANKR